jgi:hypothetical protein
MELSSFQIFLSPAQHARGELKVQVLEVIILLIIYDQELFGPSEDLFTALKGLAADRQNYISRQRKFSISSFRFWR